MKTDLQRSYGPFVKYVIECSLSMPLDFCHNHNQIEKLTRVVRLTVPTVGPVAATPCLTDESKRLTRVLTILDLPLPMGPDSMMLAVSMPYLFFLGL